MTKELEQQGQKGIFLPLQDSIKVKLGDEELIIRDTGFSIKKMNSNQAVQEYGQDSPEYLNYLKKAQNLALGQIKDYPESSQVKKMIDQTKQLIQGISGSSIIGAAAAFMSLVSQIPTASAQNSTQNNSTQTTDNSNDEKAKLAGISVASIIFAVLILIVSYRIYEKLTKSKPTANDRINPDNNDPNQVQSQELTVATQAASNNDPEIPQEITDQKPDSQLPIVNIQTLETKIQEIGYEVKGEQAETNKLQKYQVGTGHELPSQGRKIPIIPPYREDEDNETKTTSTATPRGAEDDRFSTKTTPGNLSIRTTSVDSLKSSENDGQVTPR